MNSGKLVAKLVGAIKLFREQQPEEWRAMLTNYFRISAEDMMELNLLTTTAFDENVLYEIEQTNKTEGDEVWIDPDGEYRLDLNEKDTP